MMFKCICVCVQTTHFYWGLMGKIFEFFLLNLSVKRAVKQQKNKIINKKCHHCRQDDWMILRLFSVVIVVVILAL